VKISDLLVIETGPGMAGPYVTRALRDMGARVIKVESASKLDFGKSRVPPPGKTAADVVESPGVVEMSGGKQSVALNLKTDAGRELLLGLIEKADVYVESYAPGWLERNGLSIDTFMARNPRLIALSQSAYGGDGPKRDQRAYAPLMTAAAGVESTVGYPDGRIVPQIASAVGDIVAANLGSLLVLAALYERDRIGLGAQIDMSQTEASAQVAGIALVEYGLSGEVPLPRGNSDPRVAPHGIYQTAGDDDWIALSVRSDAEWQRACATLGIPAADRDRFATTASRLAAPTDVDALVGERVALDKRDELFKRLQSAGVPAAPVLGIYEADEFPLLNDRGVWSEVQDPVRGTMRMTEVPWHFDHIEVHRRGWGEAIGASTDAVLRELLSAEPEQLAQWREAGALS
jgi:crotonobetainyl-CoA:carnitine CoA-transferase CaiB-like acyl-CoA transferase